MIKYVKIFAIIGLLVFASVWVFGADEAPVPKSQITPTPVSPAPENTSSIHFPIDRISDRITKKSFGTYVTPKNSPVSPEKFTGYHTGMDFETDASEANSEVPIFAICDGKILQKRTASGYGGLLVQSCTLDSQSVVVVYGHVSLASIAKSTGDTLTQGEKIGNLGQPPSETDGERKHLHLSIHKGSTINIRGYVATESELSAWLDPKTYIK